MLVTAMGGVAVPRGAVAAWKAFSPILRDHVSAVIAERKLAPLALLVLLATLSLRYWWCTGTTSRCVDAGVPTVDEAVDPVPDRWRCSPLISGYIVYVSRSVVALMV